MNETWASFGFETEQNRAWRQIADTGSAKKKIENITFDLEKEFLPPYPIKNCPASHNHQTIHSTISDSHLLCNYAAEIHSRRKYV